MSTLDKAKTVIIRGLDAQDIDLLDKLKKEFGEKTYTKVFMGLAYRYFSDKQVSDELRASAQLSKERYHQLNQAVKQAIEAKNALAEAFEEADSIVSNHNRQDTDLRNSFGTNRLEKLITYSRPRGLSQLFEKND